MKDYILLTKGEHRSWDAISSEEKQRIMEKYYSYVNRLKREGRFKGGSALKHGGVKLKCEKGIVVVDGPFAETKEAISGYLILQAENHDEALVLARECPALTHGESVELFELG